MKKADRIFVNSDSQTHRFNSQKSAHLTIERALPPVSRWNLTGKAIRVAALIAFLLLGTQVAQAQLNSPPFANPCQVRSHSPEKTLRAVIELISGRYAIPGTSPQNLRQFHGWDPAQPNPPSDADALCGITHSRVIGPGPTLRARLGDRVEIAFLNKIDDSPRMFSYSFDQPQQRPGQPGFGCDESGRIDPQTGLILPYPGNDKFPNCFHGSSTANLHFHGTHTSPDGLGDNVLVQVLPQLPQPDWTATFNSIFSSRRIPQRWLDLPANYRDQQMAMIAQHDRNAAAAALNSRLPAPDSLSAHNQQMINAGQWPQYIMGAFPNFFDIPDYSSGNYRAGQAPGTHWYHAHKHGSTALHILNGLAGALIIESTQADGYDNIIRSFYGWGNSYGDHEKVMVFQEFDPDQNLKRNVNPSGGPPNNQGVGIKQVLVNGKLKPTITMRPGEVQLWRLINATSGNGPGVLQPSLFQTQGFIFVQTAQDGVQFSPANYAAQPFLRRLVPNGLTLAAGNRADLLVQAPMTTGTAAFRSGGTDLFYVVVAGSRVTLPNGNFPRNWPRMPRFLNDLPTPSSSNNPNLVKFQWESGRLGTGRNQAHFPPHFMINDKQFDDRVVDQCMPLGGLQDWVLENYTTLDHPFHIHINPFQVVGIARPSASGQYQYYAPRDNYIWQDVIAIPAGQIKRDAQGNTQVIPGRVRIRHAFLDFPGTFVLHCHILAHEDRGMMQLVRIVPAGSYPRACQQNIPAHH